MKNIVQVKNDELLVSLNDIAKFSGNKYVSIQNLIVRKKKDFQELGLSIPKEYDFKSLRLNEPQTTLLIISLRSNPTVDRFRLDLVKQFYSMKEQICDNNNKQLQMKDNQLKISQLETLKIKNKRYASSGNDIYCNVHKFRVDNNLNISTEELNNILIEENILSQKLVNKYIPSPNNIDSKYDGSSIIVNINKMIDICNNRNIKQFKELPNLFNI